MVKSSGTRVRFWYGPDGQRYKQQDHAGKVTLYVGGVEVVKQGAATTYRRYVAGVLLQTSTSAAGAATNYYLFHDQLGSVVRIANASGGVVNTLDYQALGGRRDPATQGPNAPAPALTARGFTGHEMLDTVGLVHMNARLYDTYTGRFLQPDPVIEAPNDAQTWNAYTYVRNNSLKYTDPTGMFSWDHFFLNPLSSVIRGVMSGMSSTAHGVGLFGCSQIPAGWGIACAGGANYDYVRANGGSVSDARKAGVNAAFSAAVFYGIGEYFEGVSGGSKLTTGQTAAKILAHGIAGGVVSRLNGGSFGSGFAAAGFSELAAPQIGQIGQPFAETVVAAIVGGTASKLSGGKFANGAVTAAFAYAFNRLNHESRSRNEPAKNRRELPSTEELQTAYPGFGRRPPAHPSDNPEYLNQCAIRLSVALEGAGFDISTYPQVNQTTEGWARSAKGLADYLWKEVGPPLVMNYADFINRSSPVNYWNTRGVFYQPGVPHIDVMNRGYTGSGIYYSEKIWIWRTR